MMSRKTERNLIKLMGILQIIDGVITILYYGIYQQSIGSNHLEGTFAEIRTISSMYGNILVFIGMFGTLLILLGLINLMLALRYIKDNRVHVKIGVFLMLEALFSYFILDIISLILGMSAGVIMLAKNKGIKMQVYKDY